MNLCYLGRHSIVNFNWGSGDCHGSSCLINGGTVARSQKYVIILSVVLPVTAAACNGADQDHADARRARAQQACEEAVDDQLASRATAHFVSDSEHVYYDSTGGAAVAGVVATATGQRSFACILKSATDSTWVLTEARLVN